LNYTRVIDVFLLNFITFEGAPILSRLVLSKSALCRRCARLVCRQMSHLIAF